MSDKISRIRSRVTLKKTSGTKTLGKQYVWNPITNNWNGSPLITTTYDFNYPWIGGEITGDEKHPGPPYRTGGPFKNLRIVRLAPYAPQGNGSYWHKEGSNYQTWRKYVGGFSPPTVSIMEAGLSLSNVNTALSINSSYFPNVLLNGGKAWTKTKPKLERANLFVTLAESRDLPRMLRTAAKGFSDIWGAMGGNLTGETMSRKGVANQFLNKEFGWVPFLKDLNSLVKAYGDSEAYMKRITETNKRSVRRRATLVGIPVEEVGQDGKPRVNYMPLYTDNLINAGTGCLLTPNLGSEYFSGNPTWTLREQTRNLVTASGKFSFYRPEFDPNLEGYHSSMRHIQRQMTMYGLRVSPTNIYRAVPWTWLIDWFTNVADYVDLLTDQLVDSIVANYLFITEHKQTTRKFTQTLPFRQTGVLALSWDLEIETKERVGANSPYGISLSWDSLTPRQIAILAALGITRSRPAGG